MKNTYLLIGSIAVSALFASVAFAQAPALNVNMGLWEVTTKSEISGQMPPIDTSRMTPEQKAKMFEAMKALMGEHTVTTKSCLKREEFNRADRLFGDENSENCKQTLTANTATTLEASVVCTGETPSTSELHFDAASPTTLTGTMKSSRTEKGNSMTIDMTLAGKWVSANCGEVK